MSTQNRRGSMDTAEEFGGWLKKNTLHAYQEALAEEGYDDLASFSMITEDEIEELCASVKMKPGHRKKMPMLIDKAKRELEVKEQIEEAERKRKMRKLEEEDIEETQRLQKKRGGDDETEEVKRQSGESNASEKKVSLPHGKR